jgi:hypothetical protein
MTASVAAITAGCDIARAHRSGFLELAPLFNLAVDRLQNNDGIIDQ